MSTAPWERNEGGAAPVSIRAVALPTEHGGWGLLGEPLVLGLVVAPSVPGAGIAVAALTAFLARHPLKLVLADLRRGARYPRTAAAERFVALYLAIALLGLALAVATAAGHGWWVPLLAAAPMAAAQLAFDARHQGRQLLPELAGGVALGSVAAALLLAGGWPAAVAAAAWGLMAGKAITSVLYVRARLRLARGQAAGRGGALAAHSLSLAGAVVLAATGTGPWLGVAAFAALTARAVRGLSAGRSSLRPRDLGFRELGYGAGTAVLLVLGFGFGW